MQRDKKNSNSHYHIHPTSTHRNQTKMPFNATPATVGVPSFGLIHIDAVETAKAFQTYLDTASKLTGVSLDDIDRRVIAIPASGQKATLVDLLSAGMKLFDAVVWLTAGRPITHPLTEDASMKQEAIPSLHEVARAVFYLYFMLVTQARYPVARTEKDKPKIPNFLRTIMGMTEDQHVYVETVCTFPPQKFDPAWARHVKFDNFGQEVLSRFGLGVAGYRLFGPFGLYDPRPDVNPALMNAITFARRLATSPASWDVHPLTRDPNVLTKRGNLNKNLGNLILDTFTKEQIDEMVKARILYQVPEREPAHRQYLMWDATDNISGTATIF